MSSPNSTFRFAYLPWLDITQAISFGKIDFIPWNVLACGISDKKLISQVYKLLKIYKDRYNSKTGDLEKYSFPVIICIDGNLRLKDEDLWLIKPAVNFLFFCIWSSNQTKEYYFNSNAFNYYVQSTSIGSDEISIVTQGVKKVKSVGLIKNLMAFKPLEIHSFDTFNPNIYDEYIDAIKKLIKSSNKFQVLSDSLDFLLQACDDSHGNSHRSRISALISAIETLAGKEHFGCKNILDFFENKIIDEVKDKRRRKVVVSTISKNPKYRYSILSLPSRILAKAYQVRNSHVHNNIKKNIGFFYKGKNLPLLNLVIEIYIRLVAMKLEEWKLLKPGKNIGVSRDYVLRPLDIIFQEMVRTYRP